MLDRFICNFNLQADHERLSIQIPQAGISDHLQNAVVYDLSSRKVVDIGKSMEQLQAETPKEEWDQRKSTLGFVRPFDIETFEPRYVRFFLDYYALMARMRGGKSSLINLALTRFDYALHIEGYERLPSTTRQEFEYALRKASNLRIHSFTINGNTFSFQPEFLQAKRKEQQQFFLIDLVSVFFVCIGLLALLAFFVLVFVTVSPNLFTGEIFSTKLGGILTLIFILGLLFVSYYLGSITGSICSTLILSRFLPKQVLRKYITSDRPVLPRRARNWIVTRLLDQQGDLH